MGSGDFGYWAERCGNPDAYCHANANCHADSNPDSNRDGDSHADRDAYGDASGEYLWRTHGRTARDENRLLMPDEMECAVCASPIRRHIDMMFLLGYKADDIVDTLPEAPRRPSEIQAHLVAGHVDTDKQALKVTLIGYIQDAKAMDDKIAAYIEDPASAMGDPNHNRTTQYERFGFINDNKLFAWRMKAMDLRLKAVEMIAKLEGHLQSAKGQPLDQLGHVTNNTLLLVQAGDPEIAERIARTILDNKGYEIRKTEPKAIEVQAKKQADAV